MFRAYQSSKKKPKRLPEWLSVKEMSRLLEAIDVNTDEGLRDKAIFELMYSSGLRIAETLGITQASFNSVFDEVRVIGKGRKTRIVPVSKTATKWLSAYLDKVRPRWADPIGSDKLFLNKDGKEVCKGVVRAGLKRYALKAGIIKRVFPHIIRHSTATHLLENGMNLRYIQEFLGHEFISTTQIYTHMDTKRLLEVHRKCHPRG